VKTIERQYITLTEESETEYSLTNSSIAVSRWWVATADGNLSTGENIYLTRTGKTAEEAYRELEIALIDQNWTIKV